MVLILATAKHLIRLSPLRVCALGLAMVMAWLILPEPYKERVLSPKQYTSSTSVQVRAGLQEASFRYMTEKPLWGLGLGGFGYRLIQESTPTGIQMKMLHEMYDWRPVFMGEHNLYLQIGCETGMIGLILFLTLAALIIHRLFVSERRFREMGDAEGVAMVGALQISVFAFLLSGIFLHALQQRIWWMAAPTAVALCMYATTMWERHSTNKTASSRN